MTEFPKETDPCQDHVERTLRIEALWTDYSITGDCLWCDKSELGELHNYDCPFQIEILFLRNRLRVKDAFSRVYQREALERGSRSMSDPYETDGPWCAACIAVEALEQTDD